MATARLSSKGQVVIPREIREFLGLKPGDLLEFTLGERGVVQFRLAERIPLEHLRGAWKKAGDPHLSDADIVAQIREAACRRRR